MFISTFSFAQIDSTKVYNKDFFQKLTDKNGTWVAVNDDFNEKDGFSHFIMKFKSDEFGGIEGVISGVNKNSILFWKIIEFTDPTTNNTIFLQRGNYGYAIGNATYYNKGERIGEFELKYNNGVTEKHRDIHTFTDETTIVTKSIIFDFEPKQWKTQSSLIWKRSE